MSIQIYLRLGIRDRYCKRITMIWKIIRSIPHHISISESRVVKNTIYQKVKPTLIKLRAQFTIHSPCQISTSHCRSDLGMTTDGSMTAYVVLRIYETNLHRDKPFSELRVSTCKRERHLPTSQNAIVLSGVS